MLTENNIISTGKNKYGELYFLEQNGRKLSHIKDMKELNKVN